MRKINSAFSAKSLQLKYKKLPFAVKFIQHEDDSVTFFAMGKRQAKVKRMKKVGNNEAQRTTDMLMKRSKITHTSGRYIPEKFTTGVLLHGNTFFERYCKRRKYLESRADCKYLEGVRRNLAKFLKTQ